MTAELIFVGTELLLGDILNTNAQFLSRALAELGINVYRQTTVGDNPDRLFDAYKEAFARAELVITTGGLGPTMDDLTKETAARFFNRKMVLDNDSLERIKGYFARQGSVMAESNVKQAEMPEGAVVLQNDNGTAPGIILSDEQKTIILLPGPPFEAEPMFFGQVHPYLMKKQDCVLVSRELKFCGIGESALEEKIKDMMTAQQNPTIAPYAGMAEVKLRLTAKAGDVKSGGEIIKPVADELYRRFPDNIYGEGETTLEQAVVELLIQKRLTVAVAESCTGGMVASRLVNVPGVSGVLKECLVTYSNESKMARLGVKHETLDVYGAVSAECADEMAEGAAKTSGADVGLAITGVAGPDGGTNDKPVGLVKFSVYVNGRCMGREARYNGGRQRVRTRAAQQALDFLWRELRLLYTHD